ncbi:MAG: hypothetical protein ACR2O1_03295 [Boseongicola sp.]
MTDMRALQTRLKGLELLIELNLSRLISILALGGALFLAAYIGAPG